MSQLTKGPRPISQREADAMVSASLLEATRQAAAASTELLAILRGGGLVNGIREATTRTLDDAGELTLAWRVPAGSAAITNHSATDELFVSNAASPARSGRGVTRIAAGGSAVVYLASSTLTIAGTAGTTVSVTAFTGVVGPAWASQGGGGGGGGGTVTPATSTTAAVTSVGDSTTSVALLAANTTRLGGTIYNDSTADLFIALGATASTTAYTVAVPADGYYELPTGWVGPVAGVWASDAGGFARVTELQP